MNAREWIDDFAARLGVDAPTPDEFAALLDLAGEAAHSSERVAAPAATWVAAKSGRPLADALATAREIGDA
jgi:predicted RNA-binding Zn ribbon-like protein